MSAMHGCYESGSQFDRVCFPLNEIWFFSLHSFSLDLRCSTISFGSFAFCTRCTFLGLILASLLLVVAVPRFHHLLFSPCLVSLPLPYCMLFLVVVLQPMEWTLDIAAVVGSSSLSQIRRNAHRIDVSFLQSLTGLFSLCSFLFLCRYPSCRG